MKKAIKYLTLALILALSVCAAIFAVACNGDKDDKSGDYVVTVQYEDGKAVEGKIGDKQLRVQICDATNEERCYQLISLGTDGKASVKAETLESVLEGATSFAVHIVGLPSGYTLAGEYTMTTSSHSVTVVVKQG